ARSCPAWAIENAIASHRNCQGRRKVERWCPRSSGAQAAIREEAMTMRGFTALLLLGVAWALPAAAQDKNAPGVTASEIKIGNTMPYSGAASAYGAIGRAEAGYFQMI